ncbi:unnamed protein product [Phyllotreta striolata]|uniref:Carboxypeptidase n=1 Tax=Phyllotreta striolata TaxID=444603 RepID=A0A9N9TYP3_PHYSR|nr:unnamed protein product [Phyllotreta striolata]
MVTSATFFVLFVITTALGKQGFGPTDQDWGFVTVREKAHLFWWLHLTTADVPSPTDKPLILWLQGGPGSSSTGFGNFVELGPLDTDLKPRTSTWVQYANVLFVDNPVGTGFSYVEDESLLVKSNSQIADDFLVFLKEFFKRRSDFAKVPFYIFTESYGGKMTVEIALKLHQEIAAGNIECNLTGIALGDSWISPADSVVNYAPFLLQMGVLDSRGFEKIDKVARLLPDLVENKKYAEAFGIWRGVEYEIKANTYGVDMYNVLTKKKSSSSVPDPTNYPGQPGTPPDADSKVNSIMNNLVREALNVTQPWGTTDEAVFDVLTGPEGDFMKPVVDIVERLLNETDIQVSVYTADFDLICNTLGTMAWIYNMNWKDKENWNKATRVPYAVDGYYQGYEKKFNNFALYWVVRSGHMVPADNPAGMYHILQDVTYDFAV